MQGLISVIVTTYNWPEALDLSLQSLAEQTDKNYEVVAADDGSTEATQTVVRKWQERYPVPLKWSWQEDKGFRAARSRNKAVTMADGDYLILMDGDCFVRPDFVAAHRRLAQEKCIVPGQRILLSPAFTQECLQSQAIGWRQDFLQLFSLTRQKKLNRCLITLPFPLDWMRLMKPHRWQWVRTCNCALFKSDYMAVGGQDEAYEGWGYEDSDMAIRLINNGCSVKWGGFTSPCFHLWHKEFDRTLEGRNRDRLNHLLQSKKIQADRPMSQHYESY